MVVTKKNLRKEALAQRQLLTASIQHRMLAQMVAYFQGMSIPSIGCVLSYLSMPQKNEVQANIFEEALREMIPDFRICYPAADFQSGEMQAYEDDESLILEEVAFGLTQPRDGKKVQPVEIDLVFVPLLAFDKRGQRLGYGKGFYDRYLAKCRKDTLKIGLSWFEPLDELPEISSFDVPLNYCVTPQSLYVF